MTDIEELEDRIVDLQRQINQLISERESFVQWEINLKKEQTRLNEAWQDFDRRVQQSVEIRTIGLQHELNKAQYIASLYARSEKQIRKQKAPNFFARIFAGLKKSVWARS